MTSKDVVTPAEHELDQPTTLLYGREVRYELSGEQCSIRGFAAADGGFMWEFIRNDRTYPLRLSKVGMDAMIALYHDMIWHAPPAPTQVETTLTHADKA